MTIFSETLPNQPFRTMDDLAPPNKRKAGPKYNNLVAGVAEG